LSEHEIPAANAAEGSENITSANITKTGVRLGVGVYAIEKISREAGE
jgi:hypothetical protein